MSNIKPSDHGIVVEDKESGLRFARTDDTFDPNSQRKVRDLHVGESILSYGIKEKPAPSEDEVTSSQPGEPETGEAEQLDFTDNQ